jgi:hypothetical protein
MPWAWAIRASTWIVAAMAWLQPAILKSIYGTDFVL